MNLVKWLVLVLSFGVFGTCYAKASRPGLVGVDPENTIFVRGVINSSSVEEAIVRLAELSAKGEGRLNMIIDSPGGYVDPGLKLVVAMNLYKATGGKIACYVTGHAMSMAYYLLGSCSERYAFARSQLPFHPIRVSFQGPLTGENAMAIGASLLAFEMSMKDELIDIMGVDSFWFDTHWRAETSHHGADLAKHAPGFLTVIEGIMGIPMSELFWVKSPSLFEDSAEEVDDNGYRIWGEVSRKR